jgi:hypothetical protein
VSGLELARGFTSVGCVEALLPLPLFHPLRLQPASDVTLISHVISVYDHSHMGQKMPFFRVRRVRGLMWEKKNPAVWNSAPR